jgi:hypothetical protein
MARVAQANELEAKANAAAAQGDSRTASMLLFHAAGVLDAVLNEQTHSSQLLPSQEAVLRHRAAAVRQRAQELQAAAAATAEQRAEQRKADRPSPVAAVAAVGAAAALVAVGPATAVVAAASCALATLRSDRVGDIARSTGALAADAVASTRAFDREHAISAKVATVAAKAEERFSKFEDDVKEVHPNAAAAMGTAFRAAKFAAGSTRMALAASVLSAPDVKDAPRPGA